MIGGQVLPLAAAVAGIPSIDEKGDGGEGGVSVPGGNLDAPEANAAAKQPLLILPARQMR